MDCSVGFTRWLGSWEREMIDLTRQVKTRQVKVYTSQQVTRGSIKIDSSTQATSGISFHSNITSCNKA